MKKINLLLSLYFCQGLLGGFLAAALPILIRESGGSFTLVGFSARLSLPRLLKSLWAPLPTLFRSLLRATHSKHWA